MPCFMDDAGHLVGVGLRPLGDFSTGVAVLVVLGALVLDKTVSELVAISGDRPGLGHVQTLGILETQRASVKADLVQTEFTNELLHWLIVPIGTSGRPLEGDTTAVPAIRPGYFDHVAEHSRVILPVSGETFLEGSSVAVQIHVVPS